MANIITAIVPRTSRVDVSVMCSDAFSGSVRLRVLRSGQEIPGVLNGRDKNLSAPPAGLRTVMFTTIAALPADAQYEAQLFQAGQPIHTFP